MPILHSPGVMMPGQLGPMRRVPRAGERCLHAHHVVDRNSLGDAHHELDAGIGRFEDRVGGERRRHVDHAGGGAGLLDGIRHRVEHRQVEVLFAATARRDAADHLGAVLDALLGVKGALLAGEALADHAGVLVDENAHAYLLTFGGQRDDLARRVGEIGGGRDGERAVRQHFARLSAFVPSRRTTTGTATPTCLTAIITPSAIRSQRTMPPKMLTRMARTFLLDRISLKAAVTRSAVAPPPTSRKLAGLAAVQLDQVHGGHGEPGAVHHAGDVAVERDVVEVVLAGLALDRVFLRRIAQLASAFWRNMAFASMLILASSATRSPLLGDDERVDLEQRGVALQVDAVQRHQDGLELPTCGPLKPSPKASLRHW